MLTPWGGTNDAKQLSMQRIQVDDGMCRVLSTSCLQEDGQRHPDPQENT